MITNTSGSILQRGIWADVVFWAAYTLLSQLAFAPEPFSAVNLLIMLSFLAGEVVAVYAHLFFGLRPLVNKDRSAVAYVIVVILTWSTGLLIGWLGLNLVALMQPGIMTADGPAAVKSFWLIRIGWSIGTLITLTGGVFLLSNRRRQAQRERELRLANTQAELAFLRGQLNPHFLFNALNNIYVLISRDTELARESLLGFSDLLRYQLYASRADRVPLADEVDQLRKFATLSSLRMEKSFEFTLDAPPECEGVIPPLLLLPLVENAFKYGGGENGYVRARLTTDEASTSFTITNRIDQVSPPVQEAGGGGIGLTNLRRRLDLLFPDRFELNIESGSDRFVVKLQLPRR